MRQEHELMKIFRQMSDYYGPRHWWPADSQFEICVGAILTQNTAWGNVEKAIAQLCQAGLLTPERLRNVDPDHLALLIRPSGCYMLKSRRLKEFVGWFFARYNCDFEQMFAGDWHLLRDQLLTVHGIGPETCDAILLYAGKKPSFVVDSYTGRLFHRLGYLREAASYNETRRMFMNNLPADTSLYNEYHALIVEQCKQFCRKKPLCSACPLAAECCFSKT